MARIVIEEGDLTDCAVDAIVNAANTTLQLGSGVAGAIAEKAGPSVQAECDRHGSIGLGEVALTGAGDLPAAHVIHAASMELGSSTSEEALRQVTRAVLDLAEAQGFKTLAMPAIGTGVGGLSVQRCAEIMLAEVQAAEADRSSLEEIQFVLFGEPAYRVFEHVRDAERIRLQMERLRR